MMRETLLIDPVMGRARLNQMDRDLNNRFKGVSKKFGKGLKDAIKGSFLGISIGFISQLLNPLEKINEKLRETLKGGSTIAERADRLGTSEETVYRIQRSAQSLGVDESRIQEMMDSFAKAVETGRKEMQDLSNGLKEEKDISASTRIIRDFLPEKDMGKSFIKFLETLRATGQSEAGTDVFYSDEQRKAAQARKERGETLTDEQRRTLTSQGLLRTLSGQELRTMAEEEVFGGKQYGASRRLIDRGISETASTLPFPKSTQKNLQATATADQALARQQTINEIRDDSNIQTAIGRYNPNNLAAAIDKTRNQDEMATTKQFRESYGSLNTAESEIVKLKNAVTDASIAITEAIGKVIEFFDNFPTTFGDKVYRTFEPIFKGILSPFGRK